MAKPIYRLYLKAGVNPRQAAAVLRGLIVEARNIHGPHGGPNPVGRLRDEYLQWTEATEMQLSGLTFDREILTILHTTRYWNIRTIDEASARPWPLVDAEIELQTAALKELADDLDLRVSRLSFASGHVTVLDTHLLLHYLPPGQIPWLELLGQAEVRLVVPLRVVEELDAKKHSRRGELADRARRILPALEKVVGAAGAPGQLRPGVTIEVPVDAGRRRRPVDADEEVLDTCHELRQLAGRDVTLVTADTAMRLRAHAHGLTVLTMPERYQRQAGQVDG